MGGFNVIHKCTYRLVSSCRVVLMCHANGDCVGPFVYVLILDGYIVSPCHDTMVELFISESLRLGIAFSSCGYVDDNNNKKM